MKPIYLKMTSFGPYLDEEIDFSRILGQGIFLITGDTGSGKTTIFDAISVALFGESSGDERSATSFKSDFDEAELVMKVEFIFEIRGKVYKVVRIPKQVRKKIRGEGFTEEPGDAMLYELKDGQEVPLDYAKDVTIKVQEILGIDAKQFRQLVMIPQGQFRQLITESSEEREKILKRIFDVYKYQQFQKELDSQNSSYTKMLAEHKQTIKLELKHIRCEEPELLELIQAEYPNLQLILEKTKALIEKDSLTITQLNLLQKEYKEEFLKLQELLEHAKRNNTLIQAFEDAKVLKLSYEARKEEYSQLKVKLDMAEKALRVIPVEAHLRVREKEVEEQREKYKKLIQEREKVSLLHKSASDRLKTLEESEEFLRLSHYKEQLMVLNSMLPKVIEYSGLLANSQELNIQYEKEVENIEKQKLILELEQKKMSNLQLETEKLSSASLHIERNQGKLKELQRQVEHLDVLLKTIKVYELDKKNHKKIVDQFERVRQEQDDIQKSLEANNRLFYEGQAALLAKELKEGEPCPVCGNTHHILLAAHSGEIPKKETIELIQKQLEEGQLKFNHILQQVATSKQKIQGLEEKIEELIVIYSSMFSENVPSNSEHFVEGCSSKKKALLFDITLIQEQLDKDFKKEALFKSLQEKLVLIKEHVAQLVNNLNELQMIHQVSSQKKIEIETHLNLLKKEIPSELSSIATLSEQISKLSGIIGELEKTYLESKKAVDDFAFTLSEIMGSIKEVEKIGLEKRDAYDFTLKQLEDIMKLHGFDSIEHFKSLVLQEEDIRKYKNELLDFEQKVNFNLQNLLSLSEDVKDLKVVELSSITEQLNESQVKIERIQKDLTLKELCILDNKYQVNKIEALYETYQQLQCEQSVVFELAQVANGSRGTSRITFERYVLASFLDEIIGAANIRLNKMSNSRYELTRKNQITDKRKSTGLDLEVFDYYTGKARDINTLSGGEGFKASLALALGLSDIATSYAGGISLDTMFIDEGFGALSSESLDNAINCLMDLNENGRLVGIISHVQELKDRIDVQLVVEKMKTGSRTYFQGV